MDGRITRGAAWVGIGILISQLLALPFMMIIAKTYSQSDYGFINYIISLGTFIATIIVAGYPSALVRFISKYLGNTEKINTYFSNTIAIVILILIAIVLSVGFIYGFDIEVILVILGYSIMNIYLALIRGFLDYKKIVLFNTSINLIRSALLLVLSYFLYIYSPFLIILLYSVTGCIVMLALELNDPLKIHFSSKLLSKDIIKEVTNFSIPVLFATLSFSALSNVPIISLKYFYNYEAVSIYSAALTITTVFGLVPASLVMVTMPNISNNANKEFRIEWTLKSLYIVTISGIILFILVAIFGKLLLEFIFTSKYIVSYPVLVVLSIGTIFAGLRTVFCSLWEGTGRPKIAAYDIIFASVICIFFSLFLVPYLGPIGAAYGYTLGLIGAVIVDIFFWIRYRYNDNQI